METPKRLGFRADAVDGPGADERLVIFDGMDAAVPLHGASSER
jgi:hypothetical protein